MKNIIIRSFLFLIITFYIATAICYAELSDVEKEVVWFVEMCEQQASVGEHTEGMSGATMDLFRSQCEVVIAKAYGISRDDIKYLLLNKRYNTALPPQYKKPRELTGEQKEELNNEIKKTMTHFEDLDKAEKQASEMRKKYGVGQ